MITRFACLLLIVCLLTACGTIKGRPLPMVEKGDPTWALAQDHLEYGWNPK